MRIPMRSPTDTSFTPPDLNEDSSSPDRQALDLDDTSMSGSPNSSIVVPLSGHTLSPIIRILSLASTICQNCWFRKRPQRARARLRYTSGVYPNLRYTWANGGSGREYEPC